jgi:hypothetical protein
MASVLWTAEGIIHVKFMPRGTGVSGYVGPVAVLCVCEPAARQRDDRRELLTCVHWDLVDRASVLYSGLSVVWATVAARGRSLVPR